MASLISNMSKANWLTFSRFINHYIFPSSNKFQENCSSTNWIPLLCLVHSLVSFSFLIGNFWSQIKCMVLQRNSTDGMSVIELESTNLLDTSSSFPTRNPNSFEEPSTPTGHEKKGKLSVVSSKVVSSIKVVVLSAKINILMPFGPMAILVDKLFHSHVSFNILSAYNLHINLSVNILNVTSLPAFQDLVFLFSLVGILPLAERLGYTTE